MNRLYAPGGIVNKAIATFFILLASAGRLTGINEQHAVMLALSQNIDIKIQEIRTLSDSLTLKAIKAGWLPTLTFEIAPSLAPYNTTSFPSAQFTGKNMPSADISGNIAVRQTIATGGDISLNVGGNGRFPLNNDTSQTLGTTMSLAYTQPVLKGAFQSNALSYEIKISAIDNKLLSLQRKIELLSLFTTIRNAYWDYFESYASVSIARNDCNRMADELRIERAKYASGESAPLDTLNSGIQFLKANKNLLDAQTSFEKKRNTLAVLLMLPADSVDLPDSSIGPDIHEFPDPQWLLSCTQRYDPQLKIFETMNRKLEIQLRKNKNDKLPQLDVTASFSHLLSGGRFIPPDFINRNAVIGLILSYSLPNVQVTISEKQTKLDQEQNELKLKQYKKSLENKLNELQLSWRQETEKLSIEKATVDLAKKQYEVVAQEYQLGVSDRLERNKAHDDYVSFQLSLLQAQINMKRLEVLMDEATGMAFQRFGVRPE